MFEYVRTHTKIMMGLLFLLIIPSFVLFGIDGYNRFRDKGEAVARVGDSDVTREDWDQAHKVQIDRLRASAPNVDVKLFDTPRMRYDTLERLVQERVLAEAAASARLQASDGRLARELQAIPQIAALRRPDGSLDMEGYRQLVASQGVSPEGFEAGLRREIALRDVEEAVSRTGVPARTMADLALQAYHEQREVQLASFSTEDYAARIKPSEEELQAYYQSHQAQFQAPEQADIEYLVLDLNALRQSVSINDADVRAYYEQNADRLSGAEERRASHILITAAKDAPAAERDQARARATDLLAQVRKSPAAFADLARKHSQDPGSASRGGDLDFFGRGAMVKPFEDAVFAMKKGDISEVVESDFGFHIIQLTEVKTPKRKSFEEVRPQIENDLRDQQARAQFAQAAESFTNLVYEQSDSLQPAAERLKLNILNANGVTRQPAPGAKGVLANAKFLAAVFGTDIIENKRNTDAVEISPNQLASARIKKYSPAHTRAYAEVAAEVRALLVHQQAAELARKEGADKLAAWKNDPAKAKLQAAQTVSRAQPNKMPAAALDAALRVAADKLPTLLGVDLGAQGYVVVQVNKRLDRQPPDAEAAKQEQGQYAMLWTSAENQAYLGWLKSIHAVEIKVPRPAP